MLRLRPKTGSDRNDDWRCCFCLHVRTGTILLGTWHLMLHVIALGFLAAIARDPRLIEELEREHMPVNWDGTLGDAMPTPLSNIQQHTNIQQNSNIKQQPPSPYPLHTGLARDHSFIYNDMDLGALVTICTLVITLFLIYGASRGKPVHLLPFFCLQIFDFAITIMTATGYLCQMRTVRQLITETKRLPWREELIQLSNPTLTLIVTSAILIAILVKLYCLRVVWRCFKYLSMLSIPALTPFVISSDVTTPGPMPYSAMPGPDYSSLLPPYEEAIKHTPPPSYRSITVLSIGNAAEVPESGTVEQEATAQSKPTTTASCTPTDTVVMLPQQDNQARV